MQTALENSTKTDLISLVQKQARIIEEQARIMEKQEQVMEDQNQLMEELARIVGKNRIDMANSKVRIAQLQRTIFIQKREQLERNKKQQSLPFAPTQ